MELIQLIALIVVVFGILRAVMSFRDHRISAKWLVFWLLLWGAVGVLAFLPGLSSKAGTILGVGRGSDLVIYAAILFIFYMIFRIYLRLESLEHNITKLVREIAIRKK